LKTLALATMQQLCFRKEGEHHLHRVLLLSFLENGERSRKKKKRDMTIMRFNRRRFKKSQNIGTGVTFTGCIRDGQRLQGG